MDYSSLRAEARKRLAGKWGKVIALIIVTGLVLGLIGYLPSLAKERVVIWYYSYTRDTVVSVLLTFVAEIITLVISFGLIAALWKVYKGEDVGAADGLKMGFANWKRSAMILLNVAKKLLIPLIMVVVATLLPTIIRNNVVSIICLIVNLAGGIWLFIAGLHYALVAIIAADDPSMSETAVVEKSKELMTNRRGKFVVLSLTFIGWCILGILSLGIGMLWVTPYMQFATFAFYDLCKSGKAPVVEAKAEAKAEAKPEPKEEPKEDESNPIQGN